VVEAAPTTVSSQTSPPSLLVAKNWTRSLRYVISHIHHIYRLLLTLS
jgi:hypothetical protein